MGNEKVPLLLCLNCNVTAKAVRGSVDTLNFQNFLHANDLINQGYGVLSHPTLNGANLQVSLCPCRASQRLHMQQECVCGVGGGRGRDAGAFSAAGT